MSTENKETEAAQTIEFSTSTNASPNRSKMRQNIKDNENAARAPPLEIHTGSEVTVVNGDRSNLTWKRYKLLDINQRTGMCVVQGIADERQRNFPRSVVKPKNWVDKFRAVFRAMSVADTDEKDEKVQHSHHHVEYHHFFNALQLLGAEYDHFHALKIFKALDVNANGILSFRQFMNWLYGLGRTADKGRLLTTIECMTGLRKWHNSLTYYVMATAVNENMEGTAKQCVWCTAKYNRSKSLVDVVFLATSNNDEQNSAFLLPKDLTSFTSKFKATLQSIKISPVYTPSNKDERVCSMVVMGPGEIGKSALINKFVKGVFPHDYDPTIQDQARKQILVDDSPALLEILDTAGQEEFASMRYDWLKDSIDILLICFSRADHDSFIRAAELIEIAQRLLRQQKTPRIVPILLVGTKKDLSEQEFQVTLDDIVELQAQYGGEEFIGYEECSAFMDQGVAEVFDAAVVMYRNWRDGQSGVKIIRKSKTARQIEEMREVSYMQQMGDTGRRGRHKCVACLDHFCPAMAAYMKSEGSTKLNIASVPKDKFGDELAEPSYSKQHFFVQREFSWSRLLKCLIACVFFPLVITWQTIYFVFYCKATNCCFKCLSEEVDFTNSQETLFYDFLGPIVGRDPRKTAKDDNARKWFLSQTFGQKLMRLFLMLCVDVLFFFVIYNAITVGFARFDKESQRHSLSMLETLGPGQLWLGAWIITAIYMSMDINVRPEPPSMLSLRPYVMYLNPDESIRTTAYVFLRGFSKSTFAIFRLEATTERILTSLAVSIVWILIPGVVRVVFNAEDTDGNYFPNGLKFQAVTAMFVNFFLLFILTLGAQMQLMSGLEKYIEWMYDVTSMLDKIFSAEKSLNYINLVRHNNTLAWIEMRTYLYTKGLIIFSRQEIFVFYVIAVQIGTAVYIIYRLLTDSNIDDTYGSPAFVGILVLFLALTYSMMRILGTTRRIERLQGKQIALLAAQKFQIYYKRITWHPSKDEEEDLSNNELSEGGMGHYDQDWADIDPSNLPPMDENVIEDNSDSTSHQSDTEDAKEDNVLLSKRALNIATRVSTSDHTHFRNMKLGRPPSALTSLTMQTSASQYGKTGNKRIANNVEQNESMFSAEYLDQSEKFVQAVINICEAQDIIPRVFNIRVQVAVGLSILCCTFAVLPTAIRLAFGNDCDDWSG